MSFTRYPFTSGEKSPHLMRKNSRTLISFFPLFYCLSSSQNSLFIKKNLPFILYTYGCPSISCPSFITTSIYRFPRRCPDFLRPTTFQPSSHHCLPNQTLPVSSWTSKDEDLQIHFSHKLLCVCMCVFKTFVIVTFLNEDFLSNTHTSFIDLPMCNYVSITLKTPHSKQVIYKLRIRNSPRQIRPRLLYLHLFRTENILSIRSSLRLLFIYIFAMVITYDNLFVIRYILLSLTIIDDKIHSLGETRP